MPATALDISSLEKAIAEYEKNGRDLEDFFKSAETVLIEAVDREFDTEGRGHWKKSLRAELEGGKTLEKSGTLAGSISHGASHGKDFVEVGTNVPYAGFHLPPEKSGHPVTTGIMPVRDFLDFDQDEVLEELADLLGDALVR